jgi:uncharacterized protein
VTTSPDPRPQAVVDTDGVLRITGSRCTACGHPMLVHPPRCSRCFAAVVPDRFGPTGTVWSSTVVRIAVPGRTPPYTLAYVDLHNGPRVLAEVLGATERVEVGTEVTFGQQSEIGNLTVALLTGAATS